MNLTYEQIINEPAGRQLDAWVAELAMGWRKGFSNLHNEKPDMWITHPNKPWTWIDDWYPSTDMDDALDVLEKLKNTYTLEWLSDDTYPNGERFWKIELKRYFILGRIDVISIEASTAPLAICRAGLLAYELSEPYPFQWQVEP